RGRREIDGASCAEVAHALAFLAGMALELGGRLDAPAPAPVSPPPAPVLRSTAWVPERAGPAVAGLAALGARGGIAPGLRPAGEIGVELAVLRAGWWAPAVRATAVVGQGRADGAAVPLDLLLAAGRLQLCPARLARGRFEARPCAAGEVGAVRATRDGAARALVGDARAVHRGRGWRAAPGRPDALRRGARRDHLRGACRHGQCRDRG